MIMISEISFHILHQERKRSVQLTLVQLMCEQSGVGTRTPYTAKNPCKTFDTSNTLSCPSVSTEGWFQDPPPIPTSAESLVPYIKWCRSMYTVSPLYLQTPNHGPKTVQVFTEKKFAYKWTCTVQIH